MASIASSSAGPPKPTPVDSEQDEDPPPTIRFSNVQHLFDTISRTTQDFLAVTDVSPANFAEIEREREKRRRKFRFRRFDSGRRVLFIIIPTRVHEALHIGLYEGYRDQLVRSGRARGWRSTGASTRRGQGQPVGDAGEGDSTGGPRLEGGTKEDWPTLVIAAGVSESLNELRNDMRWWFATSDHQVKLVLLAKFEHARCTITLEKWEEEAGGTRPGATTTRHAAAVQPVLQQTITITQDRTADHVSYNVTGGALMLGFRALFLRDPGPGEGDFVLSVQQLEVYADDVRIEM